MDAKKIIPDIGIPVGNIFCIGRNYAEHAKEMGTPVPEVPMVFLKPTSAVCYDGDTVFIPKQSGNVHHEVELVVAIGKTGKNISEKDAPNFICGYGIGIDFTARDIQNKAKEKGHPWSVAKGFDTFAPLGNFVPQSAIPNPQELSISLSVNGKTKQNGHTSDMIFSVSHLIAYLSSVFTLNSGDLIFTGTPDGVGRVNSGDILEARLGEKISTLTLTVK